MFSKGRSSSYLEVMTLRRFQVSNLDSFSGLVEGFAREDGFWGFRNMCSTICGSTISMVMKLFPLTKEFFSHWIRKKKCLSVFILRIQILRFYLAFFSSSTSIIVTRSNIFSLESLIFITVIKTQKQSSYL